MKLALSTPNLNTAGSKYIIQDLVLHLNSLPDWEVEIIVHEAGGNVYDNLLKHGLTIHVIPLRFDHTSKLNFVNRVWKNSRALKKLGIDLLHSFDYASSFAEALSARLAGIKFVFTKTNMLWNKRYAIKRRIANAIVSLNQDQMDRFFSETAVRSKTRLIPNGVDISKFKPLSIDKHSIPTIGFVAYIVEVKGHPFFAEVVAAIKQQLNQPFQVICAGSGDPEYVDALKKKIAELGIQDEFKLAGFVNDIPTFYNQCHLAVLPTTERGEACPMAVLEALACGVPIAVSNTPGNKNIVNQNIGWVIEFGDVDAWANKLSTALVQLHESAAKGNESRAFVEANYSLHLFLQRHKELYKEFTRKI